MTNATTANRNGDTGTLVEDSNVNSVTLFVSSRLRRALFVWVPAHAVEGPASVPLDGGPLGMLDFSAGADGYFYAQSGTSSNSNDSIVGNKAAGADLAAWMIGLKKSTGLVQFTVQLAEWKDVAVGISKPSEVNGDKFTTGPLRTAYITLAPTPDFKFSVGQVPWSKGMSRSFHGITPSDW